MTTSILSPKYQIVIPKEIRRTLNLKPGQRLQLRIEGDHIEIKPVVTGADLIGLLKGDKPLEFVREGDRPL